MRTNSFQDCRHRPLGQPSGYGRAKLRIIIRFFDFFCFRKKLPLEKHQVEGAAGDAAVGDVEDGPEEDHVAAAPDGEVRRQGGVDQREVEHVDHLAVEERRVVENEPVEHRVDLVADGSGKDRGEAVEHAFRRVGPLQQLAEIHDDNGDEREAAEAQRKLAEPFAELQAEGHAVVLDEEDLEPRPEHGDALPDGHVRLDQDLDDLVDDEQQDHEQRDARAFREGHRMLTLVLRFDTERGVGHEAEPFLGNQLARDAADAVGLVLDADERGLEVLDELVLARGELARLLLGLRCGPFFQDLERGRGVFRVVAAAVVDLGLQHLVVAACLREFLQDQFLELLQFLVAVAHFLDGFFLLFHSSQVFWFETRFKYNDIISISQ